MIRLFPRLLSLDGGEGSTPALEAAAPAPQSTPSAPAPAAAQTVIAGKKVESDVADEMDTKKLQSRIAQLEDERRQWLESQRTVPAPQTVPAVDQKKSWLEGGSFFD